MKKAFTVFILGFLALGAGNPIFAQNITLIKDTFVNNRSNSSSLLIPLSDGRFGSHLIRMQGNTQRFYLNELYPNYRLLCSFNMPNNFEMQMARQGNKLAIIVGDLDMSWKQVHIRLVNDVTGAFLSDTTITIPQEYASFIPLNGLFSGDTLLVAGLALKDTKLVPVVIRHMSQAIAFTSYDNITSNGFWLLSSDGDEMTCLTGKANPPSPTVYSFIKYKGRDTVWIHNMDTTLAGFRDVHQVPGALIVDALNAEYGWVNYSVSPTGDVKLVDHPHLLRFKPMRFASFESGSLWNTGADSAGNMVVFGMTAFCDSIISKTFPLHPANGGLILSENNQGGMVGLRFTEDTVTWEPKFGFSHFAFLPGVPTLTTIGIPNAVSVGWNAPKNGGSPITSYEVRYRKPAENWAVSSPIAGNRISHTIYGLESDQVYQLQIRAITIAGAGAWSDTATAKTLNSTGLLEHAVPDVNVFPNPVKAGGIIHASGSFDLYDLLGNRLPASDVAPGTPGIYIIHVMQSGKDTYQKLVVE